MNSDLERAVGYLLRYFQFDQAEETVIDALVDIMSGFIHKFGVDLKDNRVNVNQALRRSGVCGDVFELAKWYNCEYQKEHQLFTFDQLLTNPMVDMNRETVYETKDEVKKQVEQEEDVFEEVIGSNPLVLSPDLDAIVATQSITFSGENRREINVLLPQMETDDDQTEYSFFTALK